MIISSDSKTDLSTLSFLTHFEQLRCRPVIFYYTQTLRESDVYPMYECLSKMGLSEQLDLILWVHGGDVIAARRLALLLHDFTKHLTIFIPDIAHSSGTLLCLAAHTLVFGPLATLTPLDPQIMADDPKPGMPGQISSEEIRMFRQMSEVWFGLTDQAIQAQVLTVLCQRIFPTTLSHFFRADRLMRQVAQELLQYQFLDNMQERQRIVNALMCDYFAHNFPLTYTDIHQLGLYARKTLPEETALVQEISCFCRSLVMAETQPDQNQITGIIASNTFVAHHLTKKKAVRIAGQSETTSVPVSSSWHLIETN